MFVLYAWYIRIEIKDLSWRFVCIISLWRIHTSVFYRITRRFVNFPIKTYLNRILSDVGVSIRPTYEDVGLSERARTLYKTCI